VPAQTVVKELPSAGTQERNDVFEIRSGARERAKRRRIERPTPRGEESDACDTGPDLEPSRVKVSVRNAVAREVESRPQQECCEPRARDRADGCAGRYVEGNYHDVWVAECRPRGVPLVPIPPAKTERLNTFHAGSAPGGR
jgi:hypothetical protein